MVQIVACCSYYACTHKAGSQDCEDASRCPLTTRSVAEKKLETQSCWTAAIANATIALFQTYVGSLGAVFECPDLVQMERDAKNSAKWTKRLGCLRSSC